MAFVTFDATAQDGPQGAYTAAPGGDFPVTVGSGAQRGAIALVTVRRVDAYSVSSNASLVYCRLGGVEMTLLGRIWLNNDTGSSSDFIAVYALGGQYGAMPAAGSQTLSYQQYLTGVTFCQYNAAVITLSNVDSFGTPQTTAGTETGTTFSTVAINSAAEDVIVAALSHQSTADLTSSTTGWVERQDLEQQSYAQRTIFGTNTATGSISVTASRASGVDYCTLAVNVVGPPPRNGSASGDYSWSANVNGKETPKGAVAGAYTWSATATGKEYAKGQAVFAYNFAGGSVTGKETPKGSATLPYRFPISSATGKRTPKGGATFGYGWGATATGKRTPRGNAGTGNYTWSASAAGKETPKGSVASAPYRFPISAASGKRTPKGDGGTRAWTYASAGVVGINPANKGQVISASYGYSGASSGKRVPKGQTTLGYGWGATATGKEQPKGSGGTRNYQWSATATGKETPKGAAATGNYIWSGAATGKKIMRGQAQAGFIDYATDKWLQNSPAIFVGAGRETTTEIDGLPALKLTGLNPASYPNLPLKRVGSGSIPVTPGQRWIVRAKFRHPASNVGPEERSFIQVNTFSSVDPTTYPTQYPGTGQYAPPDDTWVAREATSVVPVGYDRLSAELYLNLNNAIGNVVYARDVEFLIENVGIGKFGWSGAASGKRVAKGSSFPAYTFGAPFGPELSANPNADNPTKIAGAATANISISTDFADRGTTSIRVEKNVGPGTSHYIWLTPASSTSAMKDVVPGQIVRVEANVLRPNSVGYGFARVGIQFRDSTGTNPTIAPGLQNVTLATPGVWYSAAVEAICPPGYNKVITYVDMPTAADIGSTFHVGWNTTAIINYAGDGGVEDPARWQFYNAAEVFRVTDRARSGAASLFLGAGANSYSYITRLATGGQYAIPVAGDRDRILVDRWIYVPPGTVTNDAMGVNLHTVDSGGARSDVSIATAGVSIPVAQATPGWHRVIAGGAPPASAVTVRPYLTRSGGVGSVGSVWVDDIVVQKSGQAAYGVEQPKGQVGRQIVVDGGFEISYGAASANLQRLAAAAITGSWGIRLTPTSGFDANLTPNFEDVGINVFPVTPGETFTVEFKYRAPATNTATIVATPHAAVRTNGVYAYPALSGGQITIPTTELGVVKTYRAQFTVPANTDMARFTIQLANAYTGQALDIDDFSVVRGGAQPYGWSATVVGKRTPKGNGGTRGYSWAGGAFGAEQPKGNVANGPYRFPFSLGTGKRTPKGGATFGYRFPGAATGKETPKGTATLPYRFARLSVTGKRRPKGYVSEGTYAWDGVVFGQQVLPKMPEFAPANPPSLKLISERQHVVLHTYDGIQIAQFTTERQLSMKWSRALRETTTLDLTVPPRAGYTNISDISPWLHWASVWDDTGRELYWTGPVQRVAQTSRSLQLRAADVSVYFRRTRCPVTNRWTARNPAIIADELWRLMIDSKGFNIKPRVLRDPRGTMFDFEAVQDQEMLDQTMRKLTDLGLYWSVVAGTPVLGPAPLEPIVSLGEEHFASDQIAAVRDGTNTFNDVVLRGANTVARARKPLGGLQLETIVSMDDVFGVGNADRAVQEFVRHTGGIRDSIEMPSGAVFAPGVPLTIQDLVPSIRMTVTAYEMRRLVELETVNVTVAPNQIPQVAVDLESVDDEPPELMAAAVR